MLPTPEQIASVTKPVNTGWSWKDKAILGCFLIAVMLCALFTGEMLHRKGLAGPPTDCPVFGSVLVYEQLRLNYPDRWDDADCIEILRRVDVPEPQGHCDHPGVEDCLFFTSELVRLPYVHPDCDKSGGVACCYDRSNGVDVVPCAQSGWHSDEPILLTP